MNKKFKFLSELLSLLEDAALDAVERHYPHIFIKGQRASHKQIFDSLAHHPDSVLHQRGLARYAGRIIRKI